jgi:ketosteroid isomerase-like protein
MSAESGTPDLLEHSRRLFDAGRRSDVDGLLSYYAPEVVIEMPDVGLTFEGLPEIRRFYEDVFGLYEDLESELEELLDLGNGITFAVIRNHGRPAGSIAEVQQRGAWISVWEDAKITRVEIYVDIDNARAAAERLAEERR